MRNANVSPITTATSTALLTDRYELTMLDAALHDGTADIPSLFELFARRLPAGRRYGVVAGTGRLLEAVRDFRFTDEQLRFLRDHKVVRPETIDWLADYRFDGNAFGYREGELYFSHSPLLTFETDFAHGVVLETLALSVYNYDSAIAGAASRMFTAAHGRPLAEMGSRRMNEVAAVAGTRAAFIAGFAASSNLEAGRRWGIPTMGTAAHAWTLLHDSEEDAFRAQIEAMGVGTTLLVDTYDITRGVEAAVRVAGPKLGGVRIDSGDLASTVAAVRKQLDDLGATETKITVTNDLDEYALAALQSCPVDSYGVGTSVLTGSGHPTAGMVYKLTSRQNADGSWTPVQKTSAGKAHQGGRKDAARRLNAQGRATAEIIAVEKTAARDANDRSLLVPLITKGEANPSYLGVNGTRAAREHHQEVLQELPANGRRLSKGDPAIPSLFE
ncbi:nicotinate phosphoribosyltransferase [Pseudoclavibacter sp. 13-3]|uniref:nicotinate phosphoribosyltransferase n=1 Tax=Pseudoclavibacter sp. 13-3 TaxID=2901228 RepID=UPI001E5140BD|nr:nicotinate phosphoribosyltransferase [Pseudoclavibacter sp. 13-3]MCD7102174.1 nicotinate phosphoribosyltransferase [Pseudoclavibacter sp. 13-3]